MPKVSEAHLEARRQQILAAAASCFARDGFHHTTMQDICQEAELSPGAVYRYFDSKEEIIEAMCEVDRRRNADLIAAAEARGNTSQVLAGLADAFFSMLEEPQACALEIELHAEALRNPRVRDIHNRSEESVRAAFAEIIRRAQKQGEINPALDPDAVTRVMISAYLGLVLQKLLDPRVDIWRYVAVMKAMMGGTFWQGEKPEGGY